MLLLALLLATQTTPAPASPTPPKREMKVNFKLDAAILKQYDADKDGALNLSEFRSAMEAQAAQAIASNPEAQANIKTDWRSKFEKAMGAPFRVLDVDSDGRLTLAEMSAAKKSTTN